MRMLTVTIRGMSPYSQSRNKDKDFPKREDETHEDYDERTWREKSTTDQNGQVVIPNSSFKQAIDSAAKMLSIQVPGKGKATYTKDFVRGVNVFDDLPLGVNKEDVQRIQLYVHANGIRGSASRVWRSFPIIGAPWGGQLEISVLSETLPNEIVEKVVRASGKYIGIGRFRPENGGTNGRYDVTDMTWSEVA